MTEPIDPLLHLLCVPPARIMEFWPLVRDMIAAAYAAHGDLLPADLPKWLEAGKRHLWLSIVDEKVIAALVTEIKPKRDGLALYMVSCGGEGMTIWKDCHAQIEKFARDEGCDRVISEGRPGWSRVFALDGYKVTCVTLEKRL